MDLSISMLEKVAGRRLSKAARANANSVIIGLEAFPDAGMLEPVRLAKVLGQVCQENGAFRYDREIWGETKQQKRYDTGPLAKRLGNTPEADGDGKANAGMGPIQLTGAGNRRNFRAWLKDNGFPHAPNFVGNANLLIDPWEGLSLVWYWEAGNPTKQSLNRYADVDDIETLTLKINGGKSHLAERINWTVRASLVLLDYGPTDLRRFQRDNGLTVDGDAGPRTRAALHKALAELTPAKRRPATLAAAPVVAKKAVVPKAIDKPQTRTVGFWERVASAGAGLSGVGLALQGQDWRLVALLFGAVILIAIGGLIFQRQILARVRELKAEFGS